MFLSTSTIFPSTATTPSRITQSPSLKEFGCAAHGADAKWKSRRSRRRKLRVKMENTISLPLQPPNPSEDLSLLPPRCANPRIANQNTKRWRELAAHSQPAKKKEFENKWIGEWRKKNRFFFLYQERKKLFFFSFTLAGAAAILAAATGQHSSTVGAEGPRTFHVSHTARRRYKRRGNVWRASF